MQIIDLFYQLAREHRGVKAFFYGAHFEKGAGNETHPLVWLDDPVYGRSVGEGRIVYEGNVDILDIPQNAAQVPVIQNTAFHTGMDFVRWVRRSGFAGVDGFSFVSLREYTGNGAAGCRFTFRVLMADPANQCADSFDPCKIFPAGQVLPDFRLAHPDGCAVFSDKPGLPDFRLNATAP